MASDEETPLIDGTLKHDAAVSRQIPHSPERASDEDYDEDFDGFALPDQDSPGVARIAAISSQVTTAQRISLLSSIFLVGYAYGLESQVRSTYQPYATSSFGLHSYSSTINVLRSVIAVAAQPTAAKIADVFGRLEVVVVCTILYTVGIAVEASATSIEVFCAGGIIYQVGYTCIVLLMEVLIADFSSMRARVFFSYVPALPFLINTWISGSITSAILRVTTWRWGVGMWCIIYPIASLPLLLTLHSINHRARRLNRYKRPLQSPSASGGKLWNRLYHQLDLPGLVIIIAILALILAPLTAAGGTAKKWRSPAIILPLIFGILCVPIFVFREKRLARFPLLPFHLLADRGVWAALAVRSLLNFAWYVQGNYLYTVLIVAFDFPIKTATRILSFFSFFGVISGVLMALVIYKVRRLKYIIVAGTCLFMVAFGILIRHPGGPSDESKAGLIAGQVLLGLAGGFFAYPTQASIQAAVKHEHVAILTGLYLSFYNVGSAMGTCLSGLIWSQLLYPSLEAKLAFQTNATLAQAIYDSPFSVVPLYPVGTEIRTAIIESYSEVQRILCIAGICICVPMIGFALVLRNPRLSEQQAQPEAETGIQT
ncbi:hypothetical protein G7046_g1901 [Stylonectria norvegica]|nr:hypothetical protein G7046_g1901 [Stylonectria norvegica]